MKRVSASEAVAVTTLVIAAIVGSLVVVVLATRWGPNEAIAVTLLLSVGVLFSLWLSANPRQAAISGLVFGVLCVNAIPRDAIPAPGVFMGLRLCFTLLALFVGARRISRCSGRIKRNPYLVLLIAYTLVVLLWLVKSPDQAYGTQKSAEFIMSATIPVVAFAGLGPYDENDCRIISMTLTAWAIVAAMSLLAMGDTSLHRSIRSEGENAIMVARVMGLGVVTHVGVIAAGLRKRIGNYVVQLSMLGVMLAGMIATGSRGPLLAAILSITILLMLLLSARDAKWRGLLRVLASLGVLLVLGMLLPIEWNQMGGYSRLLAYFVHDASAPQDLTRRYFYAAALQGAYESKFVGLGTGGFASFIGVEGRMFPHNLFLEVLA
jgi:hypothetical protein